MERIYIDTALLAVPNYAIDDNSAQSIIDRVGHFAALSFPDIPVDIIIASNAEETLWGGNCGPGFQEIQEFLELMRLSSFYSASDILQQYHAIFGRAHRSTEYCGVDVIEYDNFHIEPPLPALLTPAFLEAETFRVFSTVAALQKDQDNWHLGSAMSHSVATAHLVAVDILDAVGAAPRSPMPYRTEGLVRAFTGLNDFVSDHFSHRLWVNATTAEDICLSLIVGSQALLERGLEPNWSDLDFTVGPLFLESLHRVQAAGAGRFSGAVRGLCTQLVAGVCRRHIGAFGRPNQTVRSFDGALGCRVHVTEGAEGLRLMFWRKGGSIEFANVGVKSELLIEEGELGAEVSIDLSEIV